METKDINKEILNSKKVMNIVDANCWKCGKPIKVSLVTWGGTFYGPSEFTDNEINLAVEKGVILKEQFSKTTNTRYLANTCGFCGNFIGDFFIHEYLYVGEEFEIKD